MPETVGGAIGGERERNGEQTRDSSLWCFAASPACLPPEHRNHQRVCYYLLPTKGNDVPASLV